MINHKLLFPLFFTCLVFQLRSQSITNYYSDLNCLNKVKYQTSIRREFNISKDSIFSKVFYKDTLRQEGVYYGFKSYNEIAPFEVYYNTQGLVRLKQLKLEDRSSSIYVYDKGVKSEHLKFQNGETLTFQKWVNGEKILKAGDGSTTQILDKNIKREEYKDYKRISSFIVREEKRDTIHFQVDQAAIPPGNSIYGFHNDIRSTFKYPKKAKRAGAEAVLYLNFIVDKNGELIEFNVMNKDSLDKIFVDLIENGGKQLQKWQPAYFKGVPVKTTYGVKIEYILK